MSPARRVTVVRDARPRASHDPNVFRGPYRLSVVGYDVVDVVQSVGGWLCDKIMAGWQVDVALAHRGDVRPLAILGVCAANINASLPEEPTRLAVGSKILASDQGVLEALFAIVDRDGSDDVTVWGQACPAEIDDRLTYVERRISAAAMIFKAHALLAATGFRVVVDGVENVWCGPYPEF